MLWHSDENHEKKSDVPKYHKFLFWYLSYERTQDAVERGLELLAQNETKWKRPPDYYVEMVKSDKHMQRVKGALLQEKKRMKIVQQRKDNKVSRKFGKQKGLTKQQTRKEREKANIEAINQWKKGNHLHVNFF